ncbi:MAG: hypothetical protein Q9217_005486 [Psora testacea]
MTSITRRRALTSPNSPKPETSAPYHYTAKSQVYPDTPPATPNRCFPDTSDSERAAPEVCPQLKCIGTTSNKDGRESREREAFNKIRSRTTWSLTPPSSASSAPKGTGTIGRIVSSADIRDRPPTPIPSSSPTHVIQVSESAKWILTELEKAMECALSGPKLQLDCLVIQHLRVPPAQHGMPRSYTLGVPESRYNFFNGPLNSHPTTSYAGSPPWQQSAPRHHSYQPQGPALLSLHNIFPSTPTGVLSALLSTILALNYVTTLQSTSTHPCPATIGYPSSLYTTRPQPLARHSLSLPTHIPPKARVMLGLHPPQQTLKESVSSRPPLPAYWMRQEEKAWTERVEMLATKLSLEAERVVSMCVGYGHRGEMVDEILESKLEREALVRALVRIVYNEEVGQWGF